MAMEKDDPVSLLFLKMLAIGPGQVGKSTFLKRLLGHMKWDIDTALLETQPQGSTGQAELEEVCIRYSSESVAISFETSWCALEKNPRTEYSKQINAFKSLLLKQKVHAHEVEHTQTKLESQVQVKNTSTTQPAEAPLSVPSLTEPESTASAIAVEPDHAQLILTESSNYVNKDRDYIDFIPEDIKISRVLQRFRELCIQAQLSDEETQPVDAIVNVADIGGQPAFLEMLPSLTIGPALYLVFTSILHGLNTSYPVKFKHEGDSEAKECSDYTFTTEEIIFTALSSIACFGNSDEEVEKYVREGSRKKTNSLVMLMGTFADTLKDPTPTGDNARSKLAETEESLKQQLEETDFHQSGLVEYSSMSRQGTIFRGFVSNRQQKRWTI